MASGTIQKYADGNDSGWKSVDSSTTTTQTGGKFYYRKVGNLVEVDADGVKLKSAATTRQTLGTIPSGYRPDRESYINVAADGMGPAQIGINTSGQVNFWPYQNTWDTTHSIFFHLVYFSG